MFVKDLYLKWVKYGDLLYLSTTDEEIDLDFPYYLDLECIFRGDFMLFLALVAEALFDSIFGILWHLFWFYLLLFNTNSFFV